MAKFASVSWGKPVERGEEVCVVYDVVLEPKASTITIVWPVPSRPGFGIDFVQAVCLLHFGGIVAARGQIGRRTVDVRLHRRLPA